MDRAVIGIVLGVLVTLYYRDLRDARPEIFVSMLAYVITDLMNSVFVITSRKRM